MNSLRPTSPGVVYHHSTVTRERREQLNGHGSAAVWFTGLSGSGKSTIAHAVEETLMRSGFRSFVFDGDNVRHGLCGDLGFSPEDRRENIRRIGEMIALFLQAGIISFAAFISPYRAERERVRKLLRPGDFLEVFCRCPLEVCEQRDVKGLYKKARAGLIHNYTGISAPYEEPENPELVLDTHLMSIDECVNRVVDLLRAKGVIP